MKGQPILSLDGLEYAVKNKKAVTCPGTNMSGPIPAAFLMNMSGTIIIRLIKRGLYIYKPKEKEHKHDR